MRAWRGPRWVRVVVGVWLSLLLSDGGLIHACQPDATDAPVVATGPSPVAPGDHGAAVDHGHHGSPTDHSGHVAQPSSTDTPAEHDGHGTRDCSCLGHCCAPIPPVLGTAADITFTHVVETASLSPGRPAHAVRAAWADYVLPFGTAPPAGVA